MNTGEATCFQLFGAAAKHKRIASLEPNYLQSELRFGDQQVVDLLLIDSMVIWILADVDQLRFLVAQFQHVVGDQPIVNHNVNTLQ